MSLPICTPEGPGNWLAIDQVAGQNIARAVIIINCATNIRARLAVTMYSNAASTVITHEAMARFLPPRRSENAPPTRLRMICSTTGSATSAPICTPVMPSDRA